MVPAVRAISRTGTPWGMGAREVEAFLTHLAVNRRVVAATQNQALDALVFLYRQVLDREIEGIDAKRVKESRRLPVVLAVEEISKLLGVLDGEEGVICRLLYGCGLRVTECLRLRVKDLDVSGGKIEVREGKGNKDRVLTICTPRDRGGYKLQGFVFGRTKTTSWRDFQPACAGSIRIPPRQPHRQPDGRRSRRCSSAGRPRFRSWH